VPLRGMYSFSFFLTLALCGAPGGSGAGAEGAAGTACELSCADAMSLPRFTFAIAFAALLFGFAPFCRRLPGDRAVLVAATRSQPCTTQRRSAPACI
jgi:hypothetical protein